jgi:site-specific DNA recombinase
MGKRAAIYTRISRDEAKTGIKVENQERACRDLAERLGLDVAEVFTDNDISAMRSTRGKRKRARWYDLLDAIRAGQVDAVLATEPERVQRELRDLLDYIEACQLHNVPTYTVRGGDYDLSNPDGRAHAAIITAFKQAEAEKIKQRMQAGYLDRAKRGLWNGRTRPFGYEPDGVTVREHEAATVRWAASQLLAGNSIRSIAAELNRRQVKTATGGRWIPKTIGNLLQNPRLAGHAVYRGEIIGPAVWPPILDEDVWRGVKAILSDPKRRKQNGTARVWLGSGLYLCGVCGATVTTTSDPGHGAGGQTQTAYICRSGKHVYRQATAVDEFIEEITIGVLSTRGADLLIPDQTEDTSVLHLQDAALRARLDELGRLFGDGTIDAAQLAQGTASIRQQREQVEAQLAAASRGSVLAGIADAPDPEPVWAGLDLSRKRAVVDCLMTVTILPTGRGQVRGHKRHGSRFDPASVRIEPKR